MTGGIGTEAMLDRGQQPVRRASRLSRETEDSARQLRCAVSRPEAHEGPQEMALDFSTLYPSQGDRVERFPRGTRVVPLDTDENGISSDCSVQFDSIAKTVAIRQLTGTFYGRTVHFDDIFTREFLEEN